jgi:hypothetical protein
MTKTMHKVIIAATQFEIDAARDGNPEPNPYRDILIEEGLWEIVEKETELFFIMNPDARFF